MHDNDFLNASGCADPTAYRALQRCADEEAARARLSKLMGHIFYIVELAGFRLEGRVRLVDKRTGKVFD